MLDVEDAFEYASKLKADPSLTDKERKDLLYRHMWGGVSFKQDVIARLVLVATLFGLLSGLLLVISELR